MTSELLLSNIIPFAGSGLLGYAMEFALKKDLKWMLIIVGFLAGDETTTPMDDDGDEMTTTATATATTTTTETNGWATISSESISKIAELRRLAYQYGVFTEPEVVVRCATHFALYGDNSILDENTVSYR